MTIGCYCLNISDRTEFYLGSSSNIEKRFQHHLSELTRGVHPNCNFQQAWNESKSKQLLLTITPQETVEDAQELEEVNLNWHKNDSNFTNIALTAKGGDNFSRHPQREAVLLKMADATRKSCANMSDEARKKLSDRTSGANNPMFGKTHTEEARNKISETNLGRKHEYRARSPEHVAKMSENAKQRVGPLNPFYGKTHTEEFKLRASESRKGQTPTVFNSVEIDGTVYASQTEAAKALGTCVATITHRLKSPNPKYKDYKVIKSSRDRSNESV